MNLHLIEEMNKFARVQNEICFLTNIPIPKLTLVS